MWPRVSYVNYVYHFSNGPKTVGNCFYSLILFFRFSTQSVKGVYGAMAVTVLLPLGRCRIRALEMLRPNCHSRHPSLHNTSCFPVGIWNRILPNISIEYATIPRYGAYFRYHQIFDTSVIHADVLWIIYLVIIVALCRYTLIARWRKKSVVRRPRSGHRRGLWGLGMFARKQSWLSLQWLLSLGNKTFVRKLLAARLIIP